jgi:hypothetical protein
VEAKTTADTPSIALAKQLGDSDMGAECQAMSNDFALNSGQSVMSFPAAGLNGNGLKRTFIMDSLSWGPVRCSQAQP